MENHWISNGDRQSLHYLGDAFEINDHVPIVPWNSNVFEKARISVFVLREDLNHPFIQGNKWHKLKYFLLKLLDQDSKGFVSMGGAYSNHLQALVWAATHLKKRCIFFIRGEEAEWSLNPAIKSLRDLGAELLPVSRADFKRLYSDATFQTEILKNCTNYQWVPMGGSSSESLPFVADWAKTVQSRFDFDFLVVPAATAGTAAGFSLGLQSNKTVLAIEVLRSQGSLKTEAEQMISALSCKSEADIQWISGYDYGGYARKTMDLTRFCDQIRDESGFQIEPVYSGKSFRAVSDLAQKGYFQERTRILLVHTGGIFPWTIQSNSQL